MNITSVNATGSTGTGNTSSKSSELQTIGTKGQVVDGLISKVSDKISINFSGKEVTVSKSAVQDAKEGEIRKFEIMDVSETSIVLKEVGNSTNNTENKGIISTTVETSQATYTDQLSSKDEEDASEEDSQAMEDIAKRLTGKDYATLMKEGFSLEAYELTRLDRALERVKVQQTMKESGVENQVANQEEYQKQVKKIAAGTTADSGTEKKIAEKLLEANLPVTDENIQRITNAAQLASMVTPVSDKTMSYMIGNELEPTISNLYHGTYSGSSGNVQTSETAWEEVKSQAEAVIEKAGIEVNEESVSEAKWLFQNQLPISKETLTSLEQLKQINQGVSTDEVLDKIIDTVSKGKAPEEASLGDNSMNLAKQAVEDFGNITDQAIIKVVEQKQKINLENLKAQMATENDTDATTETSTTVLGEIAATTVDIQAITAKRQIEEIRLKMTVEAGQKLAGKGIDLNTSDLQRVVDGLKELEDQYYQNLLKEGNIPETDENVQLLRETTEKVNELKTSPSYLLGTTIDQRSIQTVDSLSVVGNALKAQLDKAGTAYESLMTVPRKDMGDSIEKAFQNVNDILEDLDMETTQANQRAVKILGYNGMDINETTITNMKSYDSQVNYLMENLHPAVAVEMIRNGINPLNTPVDELNQQITQMKDDLGVTDEEKYSKYLWKLEKNDQISEDERNSYIGIYRLLNNVEKTNGAAVGSVVQAGQEMTLQNLLTAVRTRKGNGIDQKVDDEFGSLESLTFQKESISDQIQTAYHSSEEVSYYSSIVDQLYEEVSPDKLIGLENNSVDSIMNQNVERLYEDMKTQNSTGEDDSYYEEKASELRTTAENSKQSVELLNSYQIPASFEQISAVQNMLQGGQSVFKAIRNCAEKYSQEEQGKLDEAINGISEGLEDAKSMQDAYDKAEATMKNILNQEYGNQTLTTKDLAELKLLSNGIELAKSLSQKECYEIPIIAGDSVTQINLTIVSGQKDSGKVEVSLESEQLGKIQAEFIVKDQSVKGLVLCNNRSGLNKINSTKSELEQTIQNLGMEVKQMNTGISGSIRTIYQKNERASTETETTTDTKVLYQMAKTFVQYVKAMEE